MAEKNTGTEATRQPKPKKPSDFEDMEAFLAYVLRLFSDDAGYDRVNMMESLEDARFAAGEQWDPDVARIRQSAGRPALTINRLPAFFAQLIGNRRMNETVIKVIPDDAQYKDIAKVREAIIRNIQKTSRAKLAYDKAFENQVIGGQGNFQVCLDYTSDDVFEQDILIEPLPNAQSVVWDRLAIDTTGADAHHVFVIERMQKSEFEAMYPGKVAGDFDSLATTYPELVRDGWLDKDTVRVADFWRMRTRKRVVAMMQDGSVIDVTDLPPEAYLDAVMMRPDGAPYMRETKRKYAEMYKLSGTDVLEGPYELPICRVPVFRVPGWEINVQDRRVRFGLVRFLRDPQRLHNFWRSAWAEKLMQTAKAKWMAPSDAIAGREDEWRRAHLNNDSILIYNEGTQPPIPVPPAQVEVGFVQASEIAVQDLKDVSNLHEASFGQQSNEVSGKAILARQRVGEVGTAIYLDNLNLAIEECGRVINDLIPIVYDTPRTVKIMGDGAEEVRFLQVNQPDNPFSDITAGKYTVTVTTGPSYATKRLEAQESMMAAINAMPDTFAVAADLIAENMDWPGADKFAKRIRSSMPPQALGDDVPPEQQQQMAMEAQQQAAIQQQALELEAAKQMAEIEYKRAQAMQAAAQAEKIRSEIGVAAAKVAVDADKTEAEIEKMEADAASQDRNDTMNALTNLSGEKDDDRKPKRR